MKKLLFLLLALGASCFAETTRYDSPSMAVKIYAQKKADGTYRYVVWPANSIGGRMPDQAKEARDGVDKSTVDQAVSDWGGDSNSGHSIPDADYPAPREQQSDPYNNN